MGTRKGQGRPISRQRWPQAGPHRRLLELYEHIHQDHGWPSLRAILNTEDHRKRGIRLGLSSPERVGQILRGDRLPADEHQAGELARALGGGGDDAQRARELFATAYRQKRIDGPGHVPVSAPVDDPVPDSFEPAPLDQLCDSLATAVQTQWFGAARERRLVGHVNLPIRWRRSDQPVTGRVEEASTVHDDGSSFPALPGITQVTPAALDHGDRADLLTLYGGLASGRLIITGGPGDGKTSAAILLLLDALKHRADLGPRERARVPVPVLFGLQDWNPDTMTAADWITAKLTELQVLRGRHSRRDARLLLTQGRIAVILDGLDDLPEAARPRALRALSDQATFRLVLLSRTNELRAATGHPTILTRAAAIELRPLTQSDVSGYLRRWLPDPTPPPWDGLVAALDRNPDSAAAQALTSPLNLTLIPDTYPRAKPADVAELLDPDRFPTSDAISRHFLDLAITAAYTPRPGQPLPPHTPDSARRTLSVIARQSNNDREIAWWQFPRWIPATARIILGGLFGSLAGFLAFVLMSMVATRFAADPLVWVHTALIHTLILCAPIGIANALAYNLRTSHPETLATTPMRIAWHHLLGLATGIAVAVLEGVAFGQRAGVTSLSTSGIAFVLTYWLATGQPGGTAMPRTLNIRTWRQLRAPRSIVAALTAGLLFGIANTIFATPLFLLLHPQHGPAHILRFVLFTFAATTLIVSVAVWVTGVFADHTADTSPVNPIQAWRQDLAFWLTIGLVAGIATGLNPGNNFHLTNGEQFNLEAGIALGAVMGLVLSRTWLAAAAQAFLTLRYRTPGRLIHFLEDAHRRHILRTIGARYQFRHATLQDNLAHHCPLATREQAPPPALPTR
ncbi:NACHT domain-containing protein [Actinokineospora alba]|uniref:NACHT domain-containing protein n=1 Tax=Actinokineospora alba TaxID=504798 RepID=A0A1H0LNY6_9PSEU|nr:NACHT domain-containing protein [Actinokineospora alba]TDP67393.1 NACHT domain-containing protein [Actinokineospora alba]SDI97953.1 NACHT domain-containing protein [Actinokineospora alba]SDO69835.1 NACHT domain-containing protein [Actinokineospora alba]